MNILGQQLTIIMNLNYRLLKKVLFGTVSIVLSLTCEALEPEPQKWSHLPMDKNFGGIAVVHTEADILSDPTLALEDVDMTLDTWAAKYIRTFELFEKSSRIDITQAYQKARWSGLLDGAIASTSREGLADTFVRVAINLYGAPPLRGKKFGAYRSVVDVETTIGIALNMRLPTGHYLDDKILNIGQNRYVLRPQLGVMHTRGKWSTELTGEIAFHTENDDFFNSKKLKQKPLYILHGHLIYTFKPGQWVSASAGYDYGGENEINNVSQNDRLQNVGWKLSYSHPINRAIGVSFFYLGTRTHESVGLDSDSLAVSTSFVW
jgi:hypothetical protein|tara:strand:- start:8563 stop:9522 length:960 start_codon:yes stop_codon:yes gene_type:complete